MSGRRRDQEVCNDTTGTGTLQPIDRMVPAQCSLRRRGRPPTHHIFSRNTCSHADTKCAGALPAVQAHQLPTQRLANDCFLNTNDIRQQNGHEPSAPAAVAGPVAVELGAKNPGEPMAPQNPPRGQEPLPLGEALGGPRGVRPGVMRLGESFGREERSAGIVIGLQGQGSTAAAQRGPMEEDDSPDRSEDPLGAVTHAKTLGGELGHQAVHRDHGREVQDTCI